MPMSKEDRVAYIESQINFNLWLLLEYMEKYQAPSSDFLEIIVSLQPKIDKVSFTELFVRVCWFNKIEDLKVSADMVYDALYFLVDKKDDPKSAYGLLRLIYFNCISLTIFPKAVLLSFQRIYEQTILRFLKTLQNNEQQVLESLPPSPFCFTTPLINALRHGGKVFSHQIPYQYLPLIVEITCYAFNENEDSFHKFLETFKRGVKEHFNSFQKNNFLALLQKILELTKEMKPKYFGSLDHTSLTLERAFDLLKQRQVQIFDDFLIADLMEGDHDTLQQLKSRPSIINLQTVSPILSILKQISRLNPSLEIDRQIIGKDLEPLQQSYFSKIGISNPMPLQTIAFNFCMQTQPFEKWYIQMDTGSGKTALCLAVACELVRIGRRVLIVNDSPDLIFRDFKMAVSKASSLKIQVSLQDSNGVAVQTNDGINYMTFKNLLCLINQGIQDDLQKISIIFDEFDSVAFSDQYQISVVSGLIGSIEHLIAFSGSNLKEFHLKFLKECLNLQVFRINILQEESCQLTCSGVSVYTKITDQRKAITEACHKQINITPVIIISDEKNEILARMLSKQGFVVVDISTKDFLSSTCSLDSFSIKQTQGYPVFIINQIQGRGLDFRSSDDIESNGGVCLIISKLPSSFLQFRQFLGRTARIGNKGQYFTILQDQEARNCDGQVYLNQKLEELANKDLIYVSQISKNKLNITENIEIIKGIENTEIQNQSSINDIQMSLIQNNDTLIDLQNSEQIQNINLKASQKIESSKSSKNENSYSIDRSIIYDSHLDKRKRQSKEEEKYCIKFKRLSRKELSQRAERDRNYFEDYSKEDIHCEMLRDKIRTEAFREAIKVAVTDKVVVDVGAGTGVLSVFAAEAGAQKVYAVEYAKIVETCIKTVADRGLQKKIQVINSLAEELLIPDKQVDVIISEWIGYFLLFERMLPSVLDVRNRFLKPGGTMIPGKAKILVAGVSGENNSYGISILPSQLPQYAAPLIMNIMKERIVTTSGLIEEIDLKTVETDYDSFDKEVEVQVIRDGFVAGIAGWFDLEMVPDQWLSTSPEKPLTHWQQVLFQLPEQIEVKKEQQLKVSIKYTPAPQNHRGMRVQIMLSSPSTDLNVCQKYEMH